MSDARFEDGGEAPLRLKAWDAEDLQVISGLVQDAVFSVGDMRWQRPARRFAILLNRFRWEDAPAAERARRPFERVRALLVVDDVTRVATQGLDRSDTDLVLSVLALGFEPGSDGGGRVLMTLAGDGAVGVEVEALQVTLRDVTRPYAAPSGQAPKHPE